MSLRLAAGWRRQCRHNSTEVFVGAGDGYLGATQGTSMNPGIVGAMLRHSYRFVAAVVCAVALAGCGGSGNESEQSAEEPRPQGATADGREVFTQRCRSCHALADADASGSVGPNLDELEPDAQRVAQKVRAGGGGMPSFAGELSDDQISAVAEYVARSAGK